MRPVTRFGNPFLAACLPCRTVPRPSPHVCWKVVALRLSGSMSRNSFEPLGNSRDFVAILRLPGCCRLMLRVQFELRLREFGTPIFRRIDHDPVRSNPSSRSRSLNARSLFIASPVSLGPVPAPRALKPDRPPGPPCTPLSRRCGPLQPRQIRQIGVFGTL